MSADSQNRLARGHLGLAIHRMARKYPFHARVLELLILEASTKVATMGVTTAGNRVKLYYAPDFVLSVTPDELCGVLLHEVHHIVFGHLLADPAAYPDRWARTVAEEITANEFVKEPLPMGGIHLSQFPGLPPMESTDQRYERLKSCTNRMPITILAVSTTANGQTAGNATGSGDPGDQGQAAGVVLDDHAVWQEAGQDRDQARIAVRTVVRDAVIDVGQAGLPECLKEAVRGLGAGSVPGSGSADLEVAAGQALNWTALLRRYLGQLLAIQPDFTRPSRRFPELVGVVPGRRRRGARPRIMAVVDTSASITDDLLAVINRELIRLAADQEVLLVTCDTRIRQVARFKPMRHVLGRGGTDLRPPFRPAFLRKHRPDVVVFFTDGFGLAPDSVPPMPVIWCLTPFGEPPQDWGRVVRMSDAEADGS
jgi:predicted metal-dependent peptidase